MALKGNWTDKVDGVDDVLAEHINMIARAVIELEENGIPILVDSEMSDDSENAVQNKIIKAYVDENIGLALEADY